MQHRYVRKRKDVKKNPWQVRIYNDVVEYTESFPTLEHAIAARNDKLGFDPDTAPPVKILVYDLETEPGEAWVWSPYMQYIPHEMMKKEQGLMCVGYKWLHEKEAEVLSIWDDAIQGNEAALAAHAWELLNEADVVVAHNGRGFDIPMTNAKLIEHGFPPPRRYKLYDTLKATRWLFKWHYHKQDWVDKRLGGPGKLEHEGFNLWKKCMAGDPVAQATMAAYNKRDVIRLEAIYKLVRPWDPRHPNLGNLAQIDPEWELDCPLCLEATLVEDVPVYTNVSVYPGYRCPNCGFIVRGTKRIGHVDKVAAQW